MHRFACAHQCHHLLSYMQQCCYPGVVHVPLYLWKSPPTCMHRVHDWCVLTYYYYDQHKICRNRSAAPVLFIITKVTTSPERCWWVSTTRAISYMSMWTEPRDWQLLTAVATLTPTSKLTFFPTKPNIPNKRPVSRRRLWIRSTMRL